MKKGLLSFLIIISSYCYWENTSIIKAKSINLQKINDSICINGILQRHIEFVWVDSSKSKFRLDITYENKKKLTQMIWLGSWVIALYEGSFGDWFGQGMSSYNKIYITEKSTKVLENLSLCDSCYTCYRALEPLNIISDLCFQNYKILRFGECFKVSIIVEDNKIANFIKQKQTRISLISNELRVNEDELSLLGLSKSKKMSWFQDNHLNFEINKQLLHCIDKKTYYKSFKMTHQKPSKINLDVFFSDFSDNFSPIYTETYPNF